ncbi:MAG: ABC transporter ATP-binding protein [Rothia mucilaginosa]|uniref:ABC transporter ATP-binding protein n=1 Tax=Rothia mucilaginosa TaxID=43675 RepID=UPI001D52D121|nr:ABC transporter ATP-binding protein [Rothia mucilaginosa]MBS6980268.1 ABC transporter ATP-binding protein [Rothia mucilaginosa]
MTTTTPHAQTAQPAVSARNLSKTYGMGEATVHALNNVSVDFEQGKFTAIMGPSGSGKSTLMQTIATLDTPDPNPATSIRIGGTELFGLKDNALTEFRREHIGFIFQAFNLVPTLTAGQNIDLPLGLAGKKPDPQWRDYLVKTLGLETRLDHRPEQLSGGQQQRVAIVRALLARPEVIFADEPTGNLDSNSGAEVLRLLRAAATDHAQTILMVTHDANAASYADRVVFIKDGMVAGEMIEPTYDAVLGAMAQLEGR